MSLRCTLDFRCSDCTSQLSDDFNDLTTQRYKRESRSWRSPHGGVTWQRSHGSVKPEENPHDEEPRWKFGQEHPNGPAPMDVRNVDRMMGNKCKKGKRKK